MRLLLLISACIILTGPAQASSVVSLPLPDATPSVISLGSPADPSMLSDESVASVSQPRQRYSRPVIIDGNGVTEAPPMPQPIAEAPVPQTPRSSPVSNDEDMLAQEVPPQSTNGNDPVRANSIPEPVTARPVAPGLVRPL